MKLFISSDIEGTCGICNWEETEKNHPSNFHFTMQMNREVSAAVRGAQQAGVSEIMIKDAHDSARNLDPSQLPEGIRLLRGWPGNPYCMMSGIETDQFDAVVFTGYHAAAGSDGNPLSHTMHTSIERIHINGEPVSEFIINAYIAASLDIPVCFLSGDEALCRSAEQRIPNITTAAVNKGIGNGCLSLHPRAAEQQIQDGIRSALTGDYKKCKISMPEHFETDVKYKSHTAAYRNSFYPGATQKDSTTISFSSSDYWDILCFYHFCL